MSTSAVLQSINKIFINQAIIAGGYVRDVALGIQPKDVDIFVCGRYGQHQQAQLIANGWEQKKKPTYNSIACISAMFEKQGEELPLQLMVTSVSPLVVVNDYFDWGICKCWASEKGDPLFTKQFLEDVRTETLTLHYNEAYHNPYTVLAHGQRLQKKFPDYETRIVW